MKTVVLVGGFSLPGRKPQGVSVLFVHTEKGMNLISSPGELNLTETAYEKAVEKNPMYQAARERDAKQTPFAKDFAEGGLFYACKKSIGMKEKTIGLAEKVLPDRVKKRIRGALKIMER